MYCTESNSVAVWCIAQKLSPLQNNLLHRTYFVATWRIASTQCDEIEPIATIYSHASEAIATCMVDLFKKNMYGRCNNNSRIRHNKFEVKDFCSAHIASVRIEHGIDASPSNCTKISHIAIGKKWHSDAQLSTPLPLDSLHLRDSAQHLRQSSCCLCSSSLCTTAFACLFSVQIGLSPRRIDLTPIKAPFGFLRSVPSQTWYGEFLR
jgi:hypothetical protein